MKVYSQLEKAQLENTTSDTGSLPKGMITYRTDLNLAKVSDGTSMLALIDESSTQTLSNKTLATPSFTGAFTMGQTTTPSNPSSGNNKFYFKADGKLYTLDSSGNEALVGSGTGGVKNLITNGNADDTASSIFTAYADAAGTRPVDGTGGSPTVTTSISSSTPLDGTKSFLLTKPASNVQGQGWSVPFTVDPAYRAKSLKISVDYIINSGTFTAGSASAESDVIWYIYDVTNSQLIEPSNIKMFSNNSSIADKFEATFQTSATGASYRLIAHVQSTSASAFELKVDNITVSPQVYVYGTPVSDWHSFSPTILGTTTNPTVGTIANNYAAWRRVGDSMEIYWTWRQSTAGASAGSGDYFIQLPSGFTADATKFNFNTTSVPRNSIGSFTTTVNGTRYEGTAVIQESGGTFIGLSGYIGSDTAPLGGWNATTHALNLGATDIALHAVVPIVGWSSSVQMSDSADTRVVAAVYNGTPTGTLTGSYNTATFPTKIQDTHSAYSGGAYTVLTPGFYEVTATFVVSGTATVGSSLLSIAVALNGSATFGANEYAKTTTEIQASASGILYATAGQTISILALQTGITGAAYAGTFRNYLSIRRVSGPSAIAASELVAARYKTAAGQSITATVVTIVDFGTKEFDSHGAVTTGGSWKFTANIAGTYAVNSRLTTGSVAWSVGSETTLSMYKNGSAYAVLSNFRSPSAATYRVNLSGMTLIKLNAGDYIDIRHVSDVSHSIVNNDTFVYVDIERVGN